MAHQVRELLLPEEFSKLSVQVAQQQQKQRQVEATQRQAADAAAAAAATSAGELIAAAVALPKVSCCSL